MEKEMRVFIADADDLEMVINAYLLEDWAEQTTLPKEAIEFITHCENQGSVYSLEGFIMGLNLDEVTTDNKFIFITNKY
jgi:hypothetical protein